ncbi:T9SS type A sorting domain-containing protein [Ochrovirga pacifica]|uniref:T9SS type A sorting domain-containing protein n=1 Tax=Ochrovirga pacifica TaxID=1042376 RepID=UPI000255A7D5|nr:T9SS type A sorting domain-containing protein [Ochrovirga pacifica]
MKRKLHCILGLLWISAHTAYGQITENFEDETSASTIFISDGLQFDILSNITDETFDIYNKPSECTACGWGGTTADNVFIDNSNEIDFRWNDGTSFGIKTNDGTKITVASLYLFCSDRKLNNFSTGGITITGKKNGGTVYTIQKNTGFSNTETFSPNNGFTYIDFEIEGGVNNATKEIDELIFTASGDIDYLALDTFVWKYASSLTTDTLKKDKAQVIYNAKLEQILIQTEVLSFKYQLYDVLGNIVKSGKNEHEIAISNLPAGLYVLKFVEGSKTAFTYKLVKR